MEEVPNLVPSLERNLGRIQDSIRVLSIQVVPKDHSRGPILVHSIQVVLEDFHIRIYPRSPGLSIQEDHVGLQYLLHLLGLEDLCIRRDHDLGSHHDHRLVVLRIQDHDRRLVVLLLHRIREHDLKGYDREDRLEVFLEDRRDH